ncbi:MAG: HAD family hydrolase [Patescibacteria group bacterium]|nr:HAD family hydrolase [Patescibacteria group bacterium]
MALGGKPTEKAVFLDKDGTLVENIPYNVDLNKVKVPDSTREALRALKGLGFKLIVVSNQGGIALGYFTIQEMEKVREWFMEKLKSLDDFYFCPHKTSGKVKKFVKDCACRKPKPGMILEAREKYQLDLKNSWVIGDVLDDVEAGKRAGCRTIFLDAGNEREWRKGKFRQPDYKAKNLTKAVEIISNFRR